MTIKLCQPFLKGSFVSLPFDTIAGKYFVCYIHKCIAKWNLNVTNVQSNLAKDRIAVLSLKDYYNYTSAPSSGGIWSSTIYIVPWIHISQSPKTACRLVQPFLHSASVWPTHRHRRTDTQTHRPHYEWYLLQQTELMLVWPLHYV